MPHSIFRFTVSAGLLGLLASARVAFAAINPTAPGPGDSFNAGAACTIQWGLDTSNTWKNFSIDLFTGSNLAQVAISGVAQGLDGTSGTGSFSWTCPQVQPNSAIYFYVFNQKHEDELFTTRFTIASSTGNSVAPQHATQPSGDAIPWGTGRVISGGLPLSSFAASQAAPDSTDTSSADAASSTSSSSSSATSTSTATITKELPTSSSRSSDPPSSATVSSSSSSTSDAPRLGLRSAAAALLLALFLGAFFA